MEHLQKELLMERRDRSTVENQVEQQQPEDVAVAGSAMVVAQSGYDFVVPALSQCFRLTARGAPMEKGIARRCGY